VEKPFYKQVMELFMEELLLQQILLVAVIAILLQKECI